MEKTLKIGTLFSGIGAFEEALKQLDIPHEIKFACDNGEIELTPLDDLVERKQYLDLEKRVRNLNEEEKARYQVLKDKLNKRNDEIRETCYAMPSNRERNQYVDELYRHYEGEKPNYVKQSYMANYNVRPEDFHTDIRFMKAEEYKGDVDILVGGSPCQSFSTYGKKMGLNDTRGTLFYDYARIIKECQPKMFIYENVSGLLTHDKKRTWQTMIQVWESLGYVIRHQILNAMDYDHPQLRRRLFLIGFRKDIYDHEYKFPEPKTLTKKSTDFLEKDVDNIYYLGKKGFEWVTTPAKSMRRARVNQDVTGCQTATQQDNWTGDLRVERPQQRHYDDPRIFIGKWDFGNGPEDAVARKMTPRECLRLMGFSDNFKIVVKDGIAYRQSGNSIVVPVLKEIITSIMDYLK